MLCVNSTEIEILSFFGFRFFGCSSLSFLFEFRVVADDKLLQNCQEFGVGMEHHIVDGYK